jgi:hypothetical protein
MEQLLIVNALIKYEKSEKVERILWGDKLVNAIVLIDIYDNSWPIFREFEYIKDLLKEKEIRILDCDPFARMVNDEKLPEKEKNKRDYAWQVLSYIVDRVQKPNVFITEERVKLLREVTAEFNVSRNTLDNYLKRFWKRGQVRNALLSDYFKCGSPGKERKALDKKRGRPNLFNITSVGDGINVDDNIKRIFRIAINKYYNTTKKNPSKIK